MGLFRRRNETLNEQLLREAGLDPAQILGDPGQKPPPVELPLSTLAAAGVPDGSSVGPKEWDAAVTAQAPALAGSRIEFTTIPNGDLIVNDETGDVDLSPLADAVEQRVQPPYKATAQRQGGDLWAVAAKRIQVARISFPEGDKLEFSHRDDQGEFRVDGEPSDALVPPELERLAETSGDSFYVEAERIDGDLWEVRVTPL
ncbi:MAG TPA: hypothetical protein VKO84_00610 [Gaiellaceae bacterium]|nr:hypothetical protein [Gaiellaceae bacterium]